jgi:hypothetical protein
MLSASAGRDSGQRASAASSNANSVNFRNRRHSEAGVPWPSLAPAALMTCSMTWKHYWRWACGLTRQGNRFRRKESAGEAPTDAVETTALPKKSLIIGVLQLFPILCLRRETALAKVGFRRGQGWNGRRKPSGPRAERLAG